jgi:LPXTG-site transpeptidase (sortase) family protein
MRQNSCSSLIRNIGVGLIILSIFSSVLFGIILISPSIQAVISELLGDFLNPYAQFEPDEYVYDYTLEENIPRVYYMSIPKLDLYAPVIAVHPQDTVVEGIAAKQLYVPNAFAIGWSATSAPVGKPGNTVLVGHNNEYGEVFNNLWQLEIGDQIIVHTAGKERVYVVTETIMFQELGQSLELRQKNAAWIKPSVDERITLVTCWPYYSNTHRFVVVAVPKT